MSAAVSSQPPQLGAVVVTHNPDDGASNPVATAGHQSCSSVPKLGRAVSNASLANLFRRHAEREAESQRNAAVLRAKLAEGFSVRGAAVALGWSRDKAKEIATKFGLKADPDAIKRAMRQGQAVTTAARPRKPPPAPKPPKEPRAKAAPPKPEPAMPRLERNPFLTEAQQQNVNAHKNRMWASARNAKLALLPPVTPDEAARLVAEFAARRGITQCPAAAEIVEPCNVGARWR